MYFHLLLVPFPAWPEVLTKVAPLNWQPSSVRHGQPRAHTLFQHSNTFPTPRWFSGSIQLKADVVHLFGPQLTNLLKRISNAYMSSVSTLTAELTGNWLDEVDFLILTVIITERKNSIIVRRGINVLVGKERGTDGGHDRRDAMVQGYAVCAMVVSILIPPNCRHHFLSLWVP